MRAPLQRFCAPDDGSVPSLHIDCLSGWRTSGLAWMGMGQSFPCIPNPCWTPVLTLLHWF